MAPKVSNDPPMGRKGVWWLTGRTSVRRGASHRVEKLSRYRSTDSRGVTTATTASSPSAADRTESRGSALAVSVVGCSGPPPGNGSLAILRILEVHEVEEGELRVEARDPDREARIDEHRAHTSGGMEGGVLDEESGRSRPGRNPGRVDPADPARARTGDREADELLFQCHVAPRGRAHPPAHGPPRRSLERRPGIEDRPDCSGVRLRRAGRPGVRLRPEPVAPPSGCVWTAPGLAGAAPQAARRSVTVGRAHQRRGERSLSIRICTSDPAEVQRCGHSGGPADGPSSGVIEASSVPASGNSRFGGCAGPRTAAAVGLGSAVVLGGENPCAGRCTDGSCWRSAWPWAP